jgi:predicted CopG family antitoxin
MSKLINVSNNVYDELTRRKKAKNASYSEVISELLHPNESKSHSWKEMIAWAREKATKYKGKKEKTDHDLVAYGVSRDNP